MDLDDILKETVNVATSAATPTPASSAAPAEPAPATESAAQKMDPVREVSAQSIGRMLGLAAVSDLKLLEGKIDLMTAKLSSFSLKLDKVVSVMNSVPTGSDLERIDVQIGTVRNLVKEVLMGIQKLEPMTGQGAAKDESAPAKPKSSVFIKQS